MEYTCSAVIVFLAKCDEEEVSFFDGKRNKTFLDSFVVFIHFHLRSMSHFLKIFVKSRTTLDYTNLNCVVESYSL